MNESRPAADPLFSELAGDPVMAELVEEFVAELPARVRSIQLACAEADLDTLTRLAHQLKGSAGGYGFPTITDAARDAEQLAKAGTAVPQLAAAVDALASLCRRAAGGADNPEQAG